MAESDEISHLKMLDHRAKIAVGFVSDEIGGRQKAGMRVGATKTEAVISNNCATRVLNQLFWEISPEGNAAERVVQQDDRREVVAGPIGHPSTAKELTARGRNEALFGHWDSAFVV